MAKAKINEGIAQHARPIDTLRHYPDNPRTHDLKVIAESLRTNGQYRTIVARQSEDPEKFGTVLAGNGTLEAARDVLGWDEIAVEFVDCDDDTARRIVLVDNAANERGGFNDELLAKLLQEAPSLIGTGYQPDALDKLLAKLDKPVEPEVEISPALMERHDYVVLYFDNEVDWNQACQVLNLRPVKAWDSEGKYTRKGLGRLIPGAPVIRRIEGTH